MSKVISISEKQHKKLIGADEIAVWAKKQVFKKRKTESEPQSLVSGKTNPDGSFVCEDHHEDR